MHNGQQVFDAYTHIHPSIEALDPFLNAEFKAKMPAPGRAFPKGR